MVIKPQDDVFKVLPEELKDAVLRDRSWKQLWEIRLRVNREAMLITERGEVRTGVKVTEGLLRETVEYIASYSLYAYGEQMREGFITIRGGHRVGIAGRVVVEGGRAKSISNIGSINIRVSHELKGCSNGIMGHLKGNILIISGPCMGKTTLLRDILKNISSRQGESVAVVDERSEIGACFQGIPQNDLGDRCDVLDCCPKAEGMLMALRALAPTYIGVDELATKEDVESVKRVKGAGVNLAAAVHGESLSDIKQRGEICELVKQRLFDTYIEITMGDQKKRLLKIYDKDFNTVFKGEWIW